MVTTKPEPSSPLGRYLYGWPLLGVVVLTIAASFWTFDLVEYALLNAVYGADAWDAGLRVVDNKGRLSDGGRLSRFHHVVLHLGSFLLAAPVFVGSAFGLAYLNLRLHGKRLGDPESPRDGPFPDQRGRSSGP